MKRGRERQGGGERVAEVHQCTSWLVLQMLGLKGSICPSIQGQARTTQQQCSEGTSGPLTIGLLAWESLPHISRAGLPRD